MAFKLFLMTCLVSCVFSQAPADGDSLCVDPLVDNGTALVSNPFLHPSYPANVKRLMDSWEYVNLLGGRNPAWQQVDNDTSNSGTESTHLSHKLFVQCGLVNFSRKELTSKCVELFRHVKVYHAQGFKQPQ